MLGMGKLQTSERAMQRHDERAGIHDDGEKRYSSATDSFGRNPHGSWGWMGIRALGEGMDMGSHRDWGGKKWKVFHTHAQGSGDGLPASQGSQISPD